MKRHPKLQDLSRERHHALQLALQARRAATSGDSAKIEAMAAACRAAFSSELDPHFALEEDTLLPLLAATGERELVERVMSDHMELRRLCTQLQRPDAATMLTFAERLASHVRFEERELFVMLEALLDDKC